MASSFSYDSVFVNERTTFDSLVAKLNSCTDDRPTYVFHFGVKDKHVKRLWKRLKQTFGHGEFSIEDLVEKFFDTSTYQLIQNGFWLKLVSGRTYFLKKIKLEKIESFSSSGKRSAFESPIRPKSDQSLEVLSYTECTEKNQIIKELHQAGIELPNGLEDLMSFTEFHFKRHCLKTPDFMFYVDVLEMDNFLSTVCSLRTLNHLLNLSELSTLFEGVDILPASSKVMTFLRNSEAEALQMIPQDHLKQIERAEDKEDEDEEDEEFSLFKEDPFLILLEDDTEEEKNEWLRTVQLGRLAPLIDDFKNISAQRLYQMTLHQFVEVSDKAKVEMRNVLFFECTTTTFLIL